MEGLGESLFPEDLFGLDQALYDEEGPYLVDGSKHLELSTALSAVPSATASENEKGIYYSVANEASFETDFDGLLAESHSLLDHLFQQNLANPIDAPVVNYDTADLQQIEEDISLESLVSGLFTNSDQIDEPVSPVSTLPSEPSSPTDFFHLNEEAEQDLQPTIEIDSILQTLLENGPSPQAEDYCESYSPGFSPAQTEASSYSATSSDTDNLLDSSVGKAKKAPKRKIPYSKLPQPRKEKKKLQNKNAANRYRQKKKEEMVTLADQETELHKKNQELKGEVTNLEREIACMKELLSEVFDCHSF